MPAFYDMTQTHLEVSSPENMDIPQRSRNARAQARHRAKRKAYIEKLEENVAKLQAALGLTSEQVSNLPSAAVLTNRFAELEMENRRLHEQLRNLQHAYHSQQYQNGPRWSPESPSVSEFPLHGQGMSVEDGCYGRKKRRISMDTELPYVNGHSLLGNNGMGSPSQSASNAHVSRAHPPLGGSASVNQQAARGHSADSLNSLPNLNNLTSTNLAGNPYSSSFSHTANANNNPNNGPSSNHISIKSEPSFGEMSILSSEMTSSPINALPPHRQYSTPQNQQHIGANGQLQNHHAPGNGQQYRASISALDRDQRHQPTQSTYSNIVENAARSIFGAEDDGYMPSHQGSPMETRAYTEYSDYNEPQHQQQQYLAHERLASLSHQAQQSQSQPSTQSGSPTNTNGNSMIPLPYPSPTETHRGSISHHLPPNVYSSGGLPSPGLGPALGTSSPSWPAGVAISLKRV